MTAADRMRERQGACVVLDGAPCPDPATTGSLLPGVILGAFLARHADRVGGRVLDLGAGNQPYRPWYAARADSSVACDVAAHPGIDVLSTAEGLPFADATFDTVLATEVLEHVTDHERAAAEIARVLRPGGTAVVTVPFLYPVHEAPHDHRRLTHHGLASVIERHGLEVDDLVAKGGALTLVANVVLTAAFQTVRVVSRAVGVSAAGRRLLLAVERRLLRLWSRVPDFPASARRVSLGYMAVARKPG